MRLARMGELLGRMRFSSRARPMMTAQAPASFEATRSATRYPARRLASQGRKASAACERYSATFGPRAHRRGRRPCTARAGAPCGGSSRPRPTGLPRSALPSRAWSGAACRPRRRVEREHDAIGPNSRIHCWTSAGFVTATVPTTMRCTPSRRAVPRSPRVCERRRRLVMAVSANLAPPAMAARLPWGPRARRRDRRRGRRGRRDRGTARGSRAGRRRRRSRRRSVPAEAHARPSRRSMAGTSCMSGQGQEVREEARPAGTSARDETARRQSSHAPRWLENSRRSGDGVGPRADRRGVAVNEVDVGLVARPR